MIRDLLKGSKNPYLYSDKYICGCLYRSFSPVEANIFFTLATTLPRDRKLNIQATRERFLPEFYDKFTKVIMEFKQLGLIIVVNNSAELLIEFVTNIERYIADPQVIKPISEKQYNFEKPEFLTQPSPSSFLELLFQNNKIPRLCKFKPINNSFSSEAALSKQQFNYIKSSISTKIGLLIEGILKEGNKQENIKSIVKLNLLSPDQVYKCGDLRCSQGMIQGLEKINLVKRVGRQREYLRTSKYLHHYTFENKSNKEQDFIYENYENKGNFKNQDMSFCDINIIVETNSKVYTTIESSSQQEKRILKYILKCLLKIDHESTDIDEMIIGKIDEDTLRAKVFSQGITADQYFDFFRQYMKNHNTEVKIIQQQPESQLNQQLGKWKKIKFLGLDGPQTNSDIPSNVRQEVKLWEKLYQQKQSQMYEERY